MSDERTAQRPEGRTYKIVLRSLPATPGSVPEQQRLKALLKSALRRFGFRCVEVSEAGPGAK